MIKLSIIIVNYNVQYFLQQCLLSVVAASKNIATEIIVVDNNSTDGSCAMISKNFPKVKLIENEENVGFSIANNQGVAIAEGVNVLILNPDTVVAEDTLEKVLSFAEKKDDLGAVGVKFIDGTGNFLPECKRNIPTLRIATQKIRGISKNYYANQIDENDISNVEILTGAFMLMRKEVYLKIGGFDEDYFMFGEDIDLSYKLINKGFQNYYFGQTTILHYKGESTIKNLSYWKNFYGAMQIFYKKHYKKKYLNNLISNIALKLMIALKSKSKITDTALIKKYNNLLFISDNDIIYSVIKEKTAFNSVKMNTFPQEYSPYDLVIIDNEIISNKKIVEDFQRMKDAKISMRIIPKKCNYFIGSDSSNNMGKIIKF